MGVWILGAAINITGSLLSNFGQNLLKLASIEKAELRPEAQKARYPLLWLIAVATFAVGGVLNFVSFSFASQSLLAALGSVQFLSNVAFGHFVLKAHITPRMLVGTGVIIVGNLVVVAFSSHSSVTYTINDLKALYTKIPFLIYGCVLIALWLGLFVMHRRLLSLHPERARSNIAGFMFAGKAAILGHNAITLMKSVSVIISSLIGGSEEAAENPLTSPFTYGIFVLAIAAMVYWVRSLNRAIVIFDALFVIPVLQVWWTTLCILSGGVYYQEFFAMEFYQGVLFLLGILGVFLGVYLLAPEGNKSIDGDELPASSAAPPQEGLARVSRVATLVMHDDEASMADLYDELERSSADSRASSVSILAMPMLDAAEYVIARGSPVVFGGALAPMGTAGVLVPSTPVTALEVI